MRFDPKKHLMDGMFRELPVFTFSTVGRANECPIKSTKAVELHCTCRMPEEKGDEMAECDSCNIWYHHHCMDIPSEVFGETEISWKCKAC